jgi:ribonuclease G
VVPTVLFADDVQQKIEYVIKELHKKKVTVQVHPYVAAFLTKGFPSIRQKLMMKYFKPIAIEGVNSLSFLESKFFDGNFEEIVL